MEDFITVASFMEARPELPDCYQHGWKSLGRWWRLVPIMHGGMEWWPETLTLDRLWEVEERLTSEMWSEYVWKLMAAMNTEHQKNLLRSLVHASSEQKVSALAAVIRRTA